MGVHSSTAVVLLLAVVQLYQTQKGLVFTFLHCTQDFFRLTAVCGVQIERVNSVALTAVPSAVLAVPIITILFSYYISCNTYGYSSTIYSSSSKSTTIVVMLYFVLVFVSNYLMWPTLYGLLTACVCVCVRGVIFQYIFQMSTFFCVYYLYEHAPEA